MKREALHIAICDDCKEELIQIKQALESVSEKIGTPALDIRIFEDGENLYKSAERKGYDIVFLDIEMPGLHGFQLAKMLHMNHPGTRLIFVSSHENLVFDSQDYLPLGFVRKGLLGRDMVRMMRLYFRETASYYVTYKIKDGFSYRELFVKDILYVECIGHELTFVLVNKKEPYRSSGSLKAIEGDLAPYHFLRTHRNYLVNQRYVENVEKRTVLLTNGLRVDIAKDRRKQVAEAMIRYGRECHGC